MSLKNFSVPGKHNLHNLLAAIAIARAFHVDWELIRDTLPSLTLPDRRLQFIRHRGILFINDSYNAAEASVKAALNSLPDPECNGRKIAVLGSMLELGKFSHECHTEVGECALKRVEKVYCLGEESLPIYETWERAGRPAAFFNDLGELAACLKKELKAFDVVLLKGSRKFELWKIIDLLQEV
jgi:UDP-N-acetylmuramoyl-tripeptide--D-alanyl-D-alanine ligase